MVAKNLFLPTAVVFLLITFGVSVFSHPIHGDSDDRGIAFANTRNCDLARKHLNEADECLTRALGGLCKIRTASQRVIGDERTAHRFEGQITMLRERLREVRKIAVDRLDHAVLPEINADDQD
jgi:hypothetical protein